MPAINKTSLGLNQWLGNEYPKRIDFVEDNKIIDDELIKRVKYTDVATDTTSGIVKFGTETGNAINSETWKQAIGQSLGGYVSKVENKEAGKWYINDLTDGKIYKCIQNHKSTSFDITKFMDITNVGLLDKLEDLLTFGKNTIKFSDGTILEHGTGTAGKSGTYVRNTLSKDFKSISAVVPVHRGSDTSNTNISVIASSNNTFDAYSYRPDESVSIYFIVIGRWK